MQSALLVPAHGAILSLSAINAIARKSGDGAGNSGIPNSCVSTQRRPSVVSPRVFCSTMQFISTFAITCEAKTWPVGARSISPAMATCCSSSPMGRLDKLSASRARFRLDANRASAGISRGAMRLEGLMPSKPKVFRPPHLASRQQQQQEYETRRGSARQRGYSAAWDRASLSHRQSHPLCVGCQARGFIVAADVVDHVEPHLGDPVKFWAEGNWQSACSWCHSVLKQQLELMWKRGKVRLADLRLDSPAAVALARELLPTPPGGWSKSS
jgi:5-methylcytosine-specific restriction protein A